MDKRIEVGGADTAQPFNVHKRLKLIQRWVTLDGRRVLDAGCGEGGYVEALCELGAEAQGVEYLPEKVARWEFRHPADHRVKRGDLTKLDYPSGYFDVIIMNEVLEHVPDEPAALREIGRVLSPKGTLIIFSPNRGHPFETHGIISRKTGRNTRILKTLFVPYMPQRWLDKRFRFPARNYWPSELKKTVEDHGFEVVSQSYVWNTFEGIGGFRSAAMARMAPRLRKLSAWAEHMPIVRGLGVSQLIVARRSAANSLAR